MKTKVAWQDQIPMPPPEAKQTNQIWAVCYRPDGQQVLLGVAQYVFVYNATTGELLNKIKGHKDTVYCLAYSKDGQRFASGGADNSVVIWSSEGQGLLKYTHGEKIQTLCFNPVLQTLASCTSIDFGLWMSEGQNVNKTKTPAKCASCDWSPDGQLLAIGLFNGTILMRDKAGGELITINKCQSPVWTVAFCPQKFETADNLLMAGSWDQKLSLYSIQGGKQAKQVGNEKELGFDPCSMSFFPKGDYMAMAGSDRKITLWNREGVLLGTVGELDDWVWSVSVNPTNRAIFAGANSG